LDITEIETLASNHFGFPWQIISRRNSSGRRRAEVLNGATCGVFVKFTNAPNAHDKANCEAIALMRMSDVAGVRTPKVIGVLGTQASSLLALEAVQPKEIAPSDWESVAQMVASLHKEVEPKFGFPHNNFIGDFNQQNPRITDWNKFYSESRIAPMLRLLEASTIAESSEISLLWHVLERIDDISSENPLPSLLHGDLWPGNVMFDSEGPILIDPSVSFGNREVDIAFGQMSEKLSFPSCFYETYNEILPLSDGYEYRRELWQLWPLLAHVLQDGRKWMPQLLDAASKYGKL
jgi:protein-ribulosamine 3-kinase